LRAVVAAVLELALEVVRVDIENFPHNLLM
jgi:hypothetical protein